MANLNDWPEPKITIQNMLVEWLATHGLKDIPRFRDNGLGIIGGTFALIVDKLYLTVRESEGVVEITCWHGHSHWDVNPADPSHFDRILELWGKK